MITVRSVLSPILSLRLTSGKVAAVAPALLLLRGDRLSDEIRACAREGAAAMAPTPRTSVVSRPSTAKETVKKVDDADEVPAYSQENVQLNMRIVYYSRTFLSIVGGVIAGVLGLTGISGFLCYFLIMMAASGGIAFKAKFDVRSYFDSWNRVLFDGIGQGLLSFILFWTFAYDIVHIF